MPAEGQGSLRGEEAERVADVDQHTQSLNSNELLGLRDVAGITLLGGGEGVGGSAGTLELVATLDLAKGTTARSDVSANLLANELVANEQPSVSDLTLSARYSSAVSQVNLRWSSMRARRAGTCLRGS